ncbi:hypothetical protein AWV80_06255 [Cupriavidus sp. UYMU48A]|nr:hypothetical protein AWV80_06255 [Cupriavidus sp. UYMU48A]
MGGLRSIGTQIAISSTATIPITAGMAIATKFSAMARYDLAVVGIALPSIMKDLGVAPTHAGLMASKMIMSAHHISTRA